MSIREKMKMAFRNALPDKKSALLHLYRNIKLLGTYKRCTGCFTKTHGLKLITAPCKHQFCHGCLRTMGCIALEDMYHFPVRCCSQEVPVKRVTATMSSLEKKNYESRWQETSVPPLERWYCPQPTCGHSFPPQHTSTRSKLECPRCRTVICTKCRYFAHDDRECVEDPGLHEVLSIARRQRWQRCYNCHTMVEKTGGCSHIRCTCSAEFWYVPFNLFSQARFNAGGHLLKGHSYNCGRALEKCSCRGITLVSDEALRVQDSDIDVRTVVVAVDQAEREVAEEALQKEVPIGSSVPRTPYTRGLTIKKPTTRDPNNK